MKIPFKADLKSAMEEITSSFLFEPNDVVLRSRWVNKVQKWIANEQNPGGLIDSRKFNLRVYCDETNNPPEFIDAGGFKGQVLIESAKTSEQLILTVSAGWDGTCSIRGLWADFCFKKGLR